MESQRSFLVIALAICSFFLYTAWQEDHAPKPPKPATEQVAAANGEVQLSASGEVVAPAAVAQTSKIIQVNTDVLEVSIDTAGGDIVGLHLPKYTVSLEDKTPYSLMRKLNGFSYTAQSGLLGDGPDEKGKAKPIYTATQEKFTLANGQTELVVSLTLQRDELNIEKRYTFSAGKYDVRVEYFLTNNSVGSKVVQPYYYLAQTIDNGKAENMMMPVYRGGAFSTTETRYEKFSFDDMKDAALDQSTKGGWISMIEHYFVSAWVPAAEQQNQLFTMVSGGNLAVIGSKGPQLSLAAGEQKSIAATFYAGPKDQEELEKIAPGLDLTVDYGILWFLSQPLFWLMELIHGALGNLNPMGGCLPMLIQMPIFLALYWMFAESVELRQAPFFFWIQDLSVADPYFVLPVLYILSMYAMQKLTPMTVTDPMQQKIMLWMPVVFGVFFVIFPAGLVLYWVVSNLLSLAQMVYIYRDMEKRGLYVRS
jgi:YidC/Oxa1 family membrane protein insertase